jgi:hypothetical protein
MSDTPDHPSPSAEDPWAASTGHAGAAPPPHWGPPPEPGPGAPTPHAGADGPGVAWGVGPGTPGSAGAPGSFAGAPGSFAGAPGSFGGPPPAGPPGQDQLRGSGRSRSSGRKGRAPTAANPYVGPAGPASPTNATGGYGYGGAAYSNYPGYGRNPAAAGLARQRGAFAVLWIVAGAITLGIAWVVGAIVSWVQLKRATASQDFFTASRVKTRFTLLTIGSVFTVLFWVLAIIGAVTGSPNGSTPAYGPPTSVQVSLGQSGTVLVPAVTPNNKSASVKMTVTSFEHPTTVSGLPAKDTATAQVRVCATTKDLNEASALFSLSLATLDGGYGNADLFANDSIMGTASVVIPAGKCVSATVPFTIPSSAVVTQVTYGDVQTIVWPVVHQG